MLLTYECFSSSNFTSGYHLSVRAPANRGEQAGLQAVQRAVQPDAGLRPQKHGAGHHPSLPGVQVRYAVDKD